MSLRKLTLIAVALATTTLAAAQGRRDLHSIQPTSEDRFTMALTGDSIITRRLSVYQLSLIHI